MTCGVQNTLDEHVSSLECDTNDVRCSGHAETSPSRGHPAEIHHTIIGNLSGTESADNIHGTRPRSPIEVYMTFNACISSDLLSQNQLQPHDLQYLYFFRSSFTQSITVPLLHNNHHSTARSPCHPAVLHHTTSEGPSGSEAVHRCAHN